MLRKESGEIMTRILPDSWVIDQQLQLTVEDDFSYLCKLDDLAGILQITRTEFPAIVNSCYIDIEEVFGEQAKF